MRHNKGPIVIARFQSSCIFRIYLYACKVKNEYMKKKYKSVSCKK